MPEQVSREQAQQDGFAIFNRGPHLEVEVPNGHFTITARTSEGKRVTFAFCPYQENGPAQCVDILYHDSEVIKMNGDHPCPVQAVTLFTTGSNVASTKLNDEKPCTLATVLLNKEEKK